MVRLIFPTPIGKFYHIFDFDIMFFCVQDSLKRMTDMQLGVKDTCSLVDEVYKDKYLKKAVRQDLKSDAITVLEKYQELMNLLEGYQKT